MGRDTFSAGLLNCILGIMYMFVMDEDKIEFGMKHI